MKAFFKSGRSGVFILGLLLILACMVPALADNVVILTVSEDRLEACVDEKGISLQQTVEAYVHALELKGDTVQVFGSMRGNRQDPFVVYPGEGGNFDWSQGEGGRNEAYYSRTLGQLEKTDFAYDRIVVITGYLRASQARNSSRVSHPVNNLIPAIVYGAMPVPGSDSPFEVYQAASGLKFESDGVPAVNGFTKYENTLVKSTASFDAAQTLDDLLSVTYSGRTAHRGTEVTIPGTLASKTVLLVTGSNLEELRIVLNGSEVINTTTEESRKTDSNWYGPVFPWGAGQARVFEIPSTVSGNMKISGGSEDAYAVLYYLRDSNFSQKLNNAAASRNGLEYAADGSVVITMPDEDVNQELKLLYPELSYQAQVTLLDSADSFTLYSEDLQQIRWTELPNENAEVIVSICETKDGAELVPSQKLRYTPISALLNQMSGEIKIDPAENLVKRQETIITLKLGITAEKEEDKRRINEWLKQADARVVDKEGKVVGTLSFDADSLTYSSSSILMPANKGSYFWTAQLSSGKDYLFPYERDFKTSTVNIENQTPQCDTKLMSTEMTRSMQPGESIDITIPSALYTDADKDPLTITYTVSLGSKEKQAESIICENGVSPQMKISGLNEFGDWTISLKAEDNDEAAAKPLDIVVHLTDGNTPPSVDPEKVPDPETIVPLLKLSDYELVIPRGFFTDAEENNLTVYVNITDPEQNVESYTFKGKDGISSVWRLSLGQFGTWAIEIYAVDENQARSEKMSYVLKLTDALEKLPGTLSISPEAPEKGDTVTLTLDLDWPDAYGDLALREWLQQCTATVKDNYGAVYPMKLEDNAYTFKADGIMMPTEETDLIFSASIVSNDGMEPKKNFTDYNPVNVSIKNSAPIPVVSALEDQSHLIFNLSDFVMKIPADVFSDAENDDFTVKIELLGGDGSSTFVAEIPKGEEWDLIFPSFDSWSIRLTAKDIEDSQSDPFIYGKVRLQNLKLIVIIAGGAAILLISVLVIVLRNRYKRNLPKFAKEDCVQFKIGNKTLEISMPEEGTDPIPLATFAVSIPVLLSDTQWNNLKQWSVYPSKGEKPELHRTDSKEKEKKFEVDLGEGLSVATNPPTKQNSRTL